MQWPNASKFPPEKVIANLDEYGNTSAASIPLALDEAVRQGKIKAGDVVASSGFGAGLTWGAAIFRWGSLENNFPLDNQIKYSTI
jgi:3-oxoacyl-[acyl-carrier-protein] synthase-3